MLTIKLARSSLRRNRYWYLPAIAAESILVALNYIVGNLVMHPVEAGDATNALRSLLRETWGISALISIVFVLYIRQTIARQESQEQGLLQMLGLTRGNLRLVALWKVIISWLFATGIGLILGLTFLRFIAQWLARLTAMPNYHAPTVDGALIMIIAGGFLGIDLGLFFLHCFKLGRLQPAVLWQKGATVERVSANHWLLGTGGLILLIAGYWRALGSQATLAGVQQFMLAVVLVIVGTYFTLGAGLAMGLRRLQKWPHFYYRPANFLTTNGLLARLKTNCLSLATITVLCTAVMVILVSTVSLYAGQTRILKRVAPVDLTVITGTRQPHQAIVSQRVRHAHLHITKQYSAVMTSPVTVQLQQGQLTPARLNVADKAAAVMTLNQLNQEVPSRYHLRVGEVLVYSNGPLKLKAQTIQIGQRHYRVRRFHSLPVTPFGNSIFQQIILVARNQAEAGQIARVLGKPALIQVSGYQLSGPAAKQIQVANQISGALPTADQVSSRAAVQKVLNSFLGGMLFVGVVISFVMLVTTVMVLYFKQVTEGLRDRHRFQVLRQVGLSPRESRSTINRQVLIVFFLPIMLATVNMAFATPALERLLKLLQLYDRTFFLTVAASTVLAWTVVYLLIYRITLQVYIRLVGKRSRAD